MRKINNEYGPGYSIYSFQLGTYGDWFARIMFGWGGFGFGLSTEIFYCGDFTIHIQFGFMDLTITKYAKSYVWEKIIYRIADKVKKMEGKFRDAAGKKKYINSQFSKLCE